MVRKTRLALMCVLGLAIVAPLAAVGQPPTAAPKRKAEAKAKGDRQQRDKSLREVARRIGIGPGCVIADVGAGNGPDTWVFADIVTGTGKVFAEEIDEAKTKAIEKEATKRGLSQVTAVLGNTEDPALPAGQVDMAFMHFVYHHLTKPREMLQAIWRSLKPGGKLVIIDQRLGTLADWVPRADRGEKHFWIAETTVVREAREQGFRFVECAESSWHEKQAFVLVFQRPAGVAAPDRDPEAIGPIPEGTLGLLLPPSDSSQAQVAFVALGEGRKLIGPILKAAGGKGVDIVLEEWATQKDERPPLDAGITMPSLLTEKGDPKLGSDRLRAVYFLDTYHLLFHAATLLARLNDRLDQNGRIYVLDRRATNDLSRRDASHRRMIAPGTVKQELAQAGWHLLQESPLPGGERFLLVFGREGQENR